MNPKPMQQGLLFLFSVLALLGSTACARQTDSPESTAAPAVQSASATNVGTAPAAPEADTASAQAKAAELTMVVRKYAAEKQRVPKDFQELVAAGYLPSVPAAPAGKSFTINKNLEVQLTD